jgi:hypothetical protein
MHYTNLPTSSSQSNSRASQTLRELVFEREENAKIGSHGGGNKLALNKPTCLYEIPGGSVVKVAKMRKRLSTSRATPQAQDESWLDLEHAATVELTSEDKIFQSNLRYRSNLGRGGVPLNRDPRRFGYFSISLKTSAAFRWFSKKKK